MISAVRFPTLVTRFTQKLYVHRIPCPPTRFGSTVQDVRQSYQNRINPVPPISPSEFKKALEILSCHVPPCDLHEITAQDVERITHQISPMHVPTLTELQLFLTTHRLLIADAASPRETGSYKECGALLAMLELLKRDPNIHTITASAGNHALGVARSARILNMNATIVVPTTAPSIKKELIKTILSQTNPGSPRGEKPPIREFIEYGSSFDEANAYAVAFAKEKGLEYVSPYNDRNVWIGQAYNLSSILPQLDKLGISMADISTIVVPVGGGGFASGVSCLAKQMSPSVRVVGVEPKAYAKFSGSAVPLTPDDTIQNPRPTLADGAATRKYGDKTFYQLLSLDNFYHVTEDSIRRSIIFYQVLKNIVAEGAGALALAAILEHSLGLVDGNSLSHRESVSTHGTDTSNRTGTKLPIVLGFISGRNINPDVHREILGSGTLRA